MRRGSVLITQRAGDGIVHGPVDGPRALQGVENGSESVSVDGSQVVAHEMEQARGRGPLQASFRARVRPSGALAGHAGHRVEALRGRPMVP